MILLLRARGPRCVVKMAPFIEKARKMTPSFNSGSRGPTSGMANKSSDSNLRFKTHSARIVLFKMFLDVIVMRCLLWYFASTTYFDI